jgi:hypothetical protein
VATSSFTKDFKITKKETVDRLEKSIGTIKPLNINKDNVLNDMKRSEEKLLAFLRSKA